VRLDHFVIAVGRAKEAECCRVKHWKTGLAILAALSASLALADDFKTINGKEYKNAEVSRVEPDGIVLKTKSGIAKVYFAELPKEVQERYHYEAPKAAVHVVEQAAPATNKARSADMPAATEKSSPAVRHEEPKASIRLDDAQFDDLRRRDWHEDLKAQEKLKNHADYMLSLMDSMETRVSECTKCGDTYRGMLAAERKAHRENHRALSAIAEQISATKSYEDYKRLKKIETQILFAIETQRVNDANDVAELRLRISEYDAEILEIWQRDQ
jgi:hypothetical protein